MRHHSGDDRSFLGYFLICVPASSDLVQWRGVALGQGTGPWGEADIDVSYISSVRVAVRVKHSRQPPSDSKKGQHRLVINNQPVKLSLYSWKADHPSRGSYGVLEYITWDSIVTALKRVF